MGKNGIRARRSQGAPCSHRSHHVSMRTPWPHADAASFARSAAALALVASAAARSAAAWRARRSAFALAASAVANLAVCSFSARLRAYASGWFNPSMRM